ncbi:Acetylornithine deacetylase [Maioricimonas rarisocia]|uniref:Acetylornithine deacetylase n=1 Tax=Maioricimonas rarisocia TaxID=2528026 RepID=A0A517ZEA2_9PLAN|nr:M20 family metallopeptidase [Maioricimonas rarisocia]QDU40794.1 Acetylornithine deacetylase [Maioricimonas rarisocia]
MTDPLSILQQLIAIPSVNPMGRELSGPDFYETRLSDFLVDFFRELGVPCERLEVVAGRANVLARYDGPAAGPTLVLDAHQDTVPVDGMVIPPFTPEIRDGRIYGRGACDIKGGMAAMLAAFARLVRERPAGSASVVMSCTCDEEATQLGVHDLIRRWREAPETTQILPVAPTAAVVAEPTDLNVVVAHRGASRWKIRTTGKACHSSDPSRGENAIYKMARILSCLEEYAAKLPTLVPAHPLCGQATLSVGLVAGGVSVNTVPAECTIEIDRRVVPGEDGMAAIRAVGDYVRERVDVDFEMLPPWIIGTTLSDEHNGPLADRVLETVAEVAGPREKVGVPYGTHASRFDDAGVPSIVFGPGSISKAHTVDEWLPIDELHLATDVYYRLAATSAEWLAKT